MILRVLVLLALAATAFARGTGEPENCLTITQGNTRHGTICTLDIDGTDVVCVKTGSKLSCQLASGVTELGSKIGETPSEFAPQIDIGTNELLGNASTNFRIPYASCAQTASGGVCIDSTGKALTWADGTNRYTAIASEGIAGGQTVKGGTGSGEKLTLRSTSHATPGSIDIGGGTAVDKVCFKEASGNGTDSICLKAPDSVATSLTYQLPHQSWLAIPTPLVSDGTAIFYNNLANRRQWAIQMRDDIGGTAAVDFLGIDSAVLTETGTRTMFTTDATGSYLDYASAASTNSDGEWVSARFTLTRTNHRPIFTAVFKTGTSISNVRIWCGVFSGDPMGSATPSVSLAGARYDTVVDTTAFWRTATDSGTGTPSVKTTTTAIATNTRYIVQAVVHPLQIDFYIGAIQVSQHIFGSETLPSGATNLGFECGVRTLENVAKSIRLSRVHMEHE